MRLLEEFADGLLGNGWRKGTKDLAVLDAAIQDVLHLRPARVGQNAAIAERARAPFRGALKPAHDFSRRNMDGGRFDKSGLVEVRDFGVAGGGGAIDYLAHLPTPKTAGPSRRGPW